MADRRTHEAPMDWQYEDNSGPVDLTSPFTQVAKKRPGNLFSSPLKPTSHGIPFSSFGTPSKPPQSTFFTPQISSRAAAPPFRNPAFTTPRKLDDMALSEASGAEDSPALTEISDFPNDTPEADRMTDIGMGIITPSKVDKVSRYSRSPRKHVSGKGELRGLRDSPRKELQVLRKRKRHNYDRDVSSVARHLQDWDDGASESDMSVASCETSQPLPHIKKRQPSSRHQHPPHSESWFGSMLNTMDQYRSAPDNIYKWLQLGLNVSFIMLAVFCGWSVIEAIRSDIRNANEKARMKIISSALECEEEYKRNQCAKKDRPALQDMCNVWYECMTQDSDAIMRVKVTAKQVAEIINEFAEAMNLKAWVLCFAIAAFIVVVNIMLQWGSAKTQSAQPHPPTTSHISAMALDATPAHFRAHFETPRTQRYGLLDDYGTDTDVSPPKLAPPMFVAYTPSGRRSPSKGERSRSPVKYHRSPSKGY